MSNLPPSEVPQGAIRLNTDSQKLEFFAQDRWYEFATNSPTLDGGVRGVTMGGRTSGGNTNRVEFFTVDIASNATDFGDLTQTRRRTQGCASATRSFMFGGSEPGGSSGYNRIDFVTFSTTGDATDFGDQTTELRSPGSVSNSTRGITGGGTTGYPSGSQTNIIEFITMSSSGNTVDFGDLTLARDYPGSVNSPTRGIFAGGAVYPAFYNNIDFITIASTGDAQDFGDLVAAAQGCAGSCNSVIGMFAHTYGPAYVQDVYKINIASTGNSINFADRTHTTTPTQSASSPTRGVFCGGYNPSPGYSDAMEYIPFATGGTGVDFGDLTQGLAANVTTSNGHGGL